MQTSLFALEFQEYLAKQLKELPLPKKFLIAYQRKYKKNFDGLEKESFWNSQERELQSQLTHLLSSFLSSKEIAYILNAIPKITVPLTSAQVSRKEFADPISLFKILLDLRLSLLYAKSNTPCKGKIGCFTWVMPDGFGDFIALKKGVEILQKQEPDLIIQAMCFYESSWKAFLEDSYFLCGGDDKQFAFVAYPKEKPSVSHSLLVQKYAEVMQGAKWLLQFPTYYVGLSDLMQEHPVPVESLGQYGFLLAPPFSPLSQGKSMGLHPFEVGILLREERPKIPPAKFLTTKYPYDNIALAYLKTEKGALAYLFLIGALCARFKIRGAILMPTFASIQNKLDNQEGFPGLLPGLLQDLSQVVKGKIFFKDQQGNEIEWGEGEVLLQIIEIGPSTEEELYALASISTLPIGCRGDQSFTEAVSLQKPFFYDPPAHAANFLIDLARFGGYYTESPSLCKWLEGSSKVLSDEDPKSIGMDLANLYPNLEALKVDFAKLTSSIETKANCNEFLRGRLKRIFMHEQNPSLQKEEEELYLALDLIIKRNRLDLAKLAEWNKKRERFESKIV